MSAIITTTLEIHELIVPVAVESAVERRDVTLGRAINGKEIRRIDVEDPGPDATQIVIDPVIRDRKGRVAGAQFYGEVQRGVWEGGMFHPISQDALDQIESIGKVDAIVVDKFVPLRDIPWERVNGAYYIVPQQGFSPKPLVLIREAMRREKAAGACKFVLRSRQRLGLLYPANGGLMLLSLAFAADFEKAQADMALSHPDGVSKEMVEMARRLIQANMAEAATLDRYEDDLIPLKQRLVEDALAGRPVVAPRQRKVKAPTLAESDPLMAALKASVADARVRKAKEAKERKVPV